MSLIKFQNVSKIYHVGEVEINAISNINFEINEGEFVVILGSSGAGKTTILNLLGGMDSVTNGKINVDGALISAFSEKQKTKYRRNDVGFVFQFYNLIQNLTALENVEMAASLAKNHLDSNEILEKVGLSERKDNFPSQLSGGEQQRVAIARAIAKNPKLLLCDEPTGALDYKTGKKILKLLQEINENDKKTIIIITHNSALANIGHRVIKVHSGQISDCIINQNPQSIDEVEW